MTIAETGPSSLSAECWLRDEVAPSYDRWKADPDAVLSPDDVDARMRRRHEARLKEGR